MVWPWGTAVMAVVAVSGPAFAQSERDLQNRYCGGAGMETNVRMPDGTYADCLSATHAIEVDFSRKWAEAIGQALHYALWTADPVWNHDQVSPRRAGIILLCVSSQDVCTDHFVRLFRVVESFRLPVTIWDCDPRTDMTLETCQRVEGDRELGTGNKPPAFLSR